MRPGVAIFVDIMTISKQSLNQINEVKSQVIYYNTICSYIFSNIKKIANFRLKILMSTELKGCHKNLIHFFIQVFLSVYQALSLQDMNYRL